MRVIHNHPEILGFCYTGDDGTITIHISMVGLKMDSGISPSLVRVIIENHVRALFSIQKKAVRV